MSALSVRQAGRLAAGAISFLAWSAGCATGTHPGDENTDPLVQGDTAGSTSTAGTDPGGTAGVATAGDTSVAGTPAAGTAATAGMGGTLATGGTSGGADAGGVGGTAGAGGVTGGAGAGGAGAGGMAGSAGMAGAGGAAPVGFRYAKLVATSEQAGAVWSSVAELQIMTTGNAEISRAGWAIVADSQELNNENDPATNAIDGDTATFWHTSWEPAPDNVNDAKLPHSLTIDMVTPHLVTGFSYLPRQVGKNGHIKGWEFYVSKDGVAWGSALKTGNFPDVITLQTVVF